jgi:hypothetical protein
LHLHLQAAAKQLDDVPVVDLGEDEHLPGELLGLSLLHHLGLLDGHHRTVRKYTSVDNAVAAAAEDLVSGEVVGGLLELFGGEYLEPAGGISGSSTVGPHLLLQDDASIVLEEPLLCSDELALLQPQAETAEHGS